MLAFSIQLLIDTYQRRRLGAKYSNKNVAMMGIATPMKYCPMCVEKKCNCCAMPPRLKIHPNEIVLSCWDYDKETSLLIAKPHGNYGQRN